MREYWHHNGVNAEAIQFLDDRGIVRRQKNKTFGVSVKDVKQLIKRSKVPVKLLLYFHSY